MAREGVGTTENLTARPIRAARSVKLQLVIAGENDNESSMTKILAEFDGSVPLGKIDDLYKKIMTAADKILTEENNG